MSNARRGESSPAANFYFHTTTHAILKHSVELGQADFIGALG
jgi:hypothetical protein